MPFRTPKILFIILCLSTASYGFKANSYPAADGTKRFEKDGLLFDYAPEWELSDQSNQAAQQLVLTEKALDAQIMLIVLREPITSPKQEEEAKGAVIEPGINHLIKQYETAGINVKRSPLSGEVGKLPAEGLKLDFEVDRQPGATDIYWLIVNGRLIQLFFIRPAKTTAKATACWDTIRRTIQIEKSDAKPKAAK